VGPPFDRKNRDFLKTSASAEQGSKGVWGVGVVDGSGDSIRCRKPWERPPYTGSTANR
jgi:hypothetical protein